VTDRKEHLLLKPHFDLQSDVYTAVFSLPASAMDMAHSFAAFKKTFGTSAPPRQQAHSLDRRPACADRLLLPYYRSVSSRGGGVVGSGATPIGLLRWSCKMHAPIANHSTMAVLTSLAVDHPSEPAKLNPEVQPSLSDFIMRMLAKDRDARPGSAAEVAAELRAIGKKITSVPDGFHVHKTVLRFLDQRAKSIETGEEVPLHFTPRLCRLGMTS